MFVDFCAHLLLHVKTSVRALRPYVYNTISCCIRGVTLLLFILREEIASSPLHLTHLLFVGGVLLEKSSLQKEKTNEHEHSFPK